MRLYHVYTTDPEYYVYAESVIDAAREAHATLMAMERCGRIVSVIQVADTEQDTLVLWEVEQ